MRPAVAAERLALAVLAAATGSMALTAGCASGPVGSMARGWTLVAGEPACLPEAIAAGIDGNASTNGITEIWTVSQMAGDPNTGQGCNIVVLDGTGAAGLFWDPVRSSITGTPSNSSLGYCVATVRKTVTVTEHGRCSSTIDASGDPTGTEMTTVIEVVECSNQSCGRAHNDDIRYYCDNEGSPYDNQYRCRCNDDDGQPCDTMASTSITHSEQTSRWAWYVVVPVMVVVVLSLVVGYKQHATRLTAEAARYMLYLDFVVPTPDKEYEIDPRDLDFGDRISIGEGQFGKVYRGLYRGRKLLGSFKRNENWLQHQVHSLLVRRGTGMSPAVPHDASSPPAGGRSTAAAPGAVSDSGEVIGGANEYIQVAVKLCNKSSLNSDDINSFLAEAILMKGLIHPNVVKLLGEVTQLHDQKQTKVTDICIVLEFCEGGDLLQYLRNNCPRLSEDGSLLERPGIEPIQALELALGVANGVDYLHTEHRIVHRDLAARNCLVSFQKNGGRQVKISDFGLSRKVPKKSTNVVGGLVRPESDDGGLYIPHNPDVPLPVRWMALESILNLEFSFASDVWSLSVLLFEIFSRGKTPYEMNTNAEVINLMKGGHRLGQPSLCPDAIYSEAMMASWSEEVRARPTAADIGRTLSDVAVSFAQDRHSLGHVEFSAKHRKIGSRLSSSSSSSFESSAPGGTSKRWQSIERRSTWDPGYGSRQTETLTSGSDQESPLRSPMPLVVAGTAMRAGRTTRLGGSGSQPTPALYSQTRIGRGSGSDTDGEFSPRSAASSYADGAGGGRSRARPPPVFYSAFNRQPAAIVRQNGAFIASLSPIPVSPMEAATSEDYLEIGGGGGGGCGVGDAEDRPDSPASASQPGSTVSYVAVNVQPQGNGPPLFYSVVGDLQTEHGADDSSGSAGIAPGRDAPSAPTPLWSAHPAGAPVLTPAPTALEDVVLENEKLKREIVLLRNQVAALHMSQGWPDSVALAEEEENRPLLATARAPLGNAIITVV